MNTHETYCSLETCKLLKQAGFDWECPQIYLQTVRGHEIHGMYKGWIPSPHDFWCPTLSVAQKWLREIEQCNVQVYPMFSFDGVLEYYFVEIIYKNPYDSRLCIKSNRFTTYE